jgi:hypothetical protein
MKTLKIIAITFVTGLVFCSSILVGQRVDQNLKVDQDKPGGFAVLELFTSEGCSSCPAADELLARIQKTSANKSIYILSYHIDYWNRLGWKDPFSDPAFTKRQYEYSKHFAGQIYTPQLIINGNAEFVGSDAAAINNAINNRLATPSSTQLSIQAQQQSEYIEVRYQVSGSRGSEQLILALVKKNAQTDVERGENKGRILSHIQIVHQFYTFDLASGGKGVQKINLPQGFNTTEWEVIGILQNTAKGVINGGARAAFLPMENAE